MHCKNLNDVESWWQVLVQNDIVIRRYAEADLDQIDTFDYMKVLKENLDEWLAGKDHATFWHLKQLMINLQRNDVRIPVVMTLNNGAPFLDPGGSRFTVLKHLKKSTVGVDVVYPTSRLDELTLGEYVTLQNAQELLEPYEKIGVDYVMDVCYDAPCPTCEKNKVIHNGAYRYSISWSRPWFYEHDYHEWYAKNKDKKVTEPMDWYFV